MTDRRPRPWRVIRLADRPLKGWPDTMVATWGFVCLHCWRRDETQRERHHARTFAAEHWLQHFPKAHLDPRWFDD